MIIIILAIKTFDPAVLGMFLVFNLVVLVLSLISLAKPWENQCLVRNLHISILLRSCTDLKVFCEDCLPENG